jgi:hypothetical protein
MPRPLPLGHADADPAREVWPRLSVERALTAGTTDGCLASKAPKADDYDAEPAALASSHSMMEALLGSVRLTDRTDPRRIRITGDGSSPCQPAAFYGAAPRAHTRRLVARLSQISVQNRAKR